MLFVLIKYTARKFTRYFLLENDRSFEQELESRFLLLDVIRWHVHEAKMFRVCGSLEYLGYSLSGKLEAGVEFSGRNLLAKLIAVDLFLAFEVGV